MDSLTGFTSLISITAILHTTSDRIDQWQLTNEAADFKTATTAHINAIMPVVEQWYKQKISIADIPDALGPECQAVAATGHELGQAAKVDGMSQDAIEAIGNDVLETVSGALQNSK